MQNFPEDPQQQSGIDHESGTSSPPEKIGGEEIEHVQDTTRVVNEGEEQRLIRKLDRRIVPMMVC